jgi:hypothetical protein
MKKLILIISVLLSLTASSQIYQPYNQFGNRFNRTVALFNLGIPRDTIAPPTDYQNYPHIAAKGDTLYIWNTSTLAWQEYSSGGSSYTTPYSVVAPGNAIQLENDTTANPANYFYGRNSAGRRGWYPQSGITNWANSDLTLTGNREHEANNNGITIHNLSGLNYEINDGDGYTGIIGFSGDLADNSYHIFNKGSNGNNEAGIDGFRSTNKFYSVSDGDSSFVQTDGVNGISIKAFDGLLRIPLLNSTTDTTGKSLVIRNLTTGLLENIDPALIGGGGSVWGTITGTLSDQTDLQAALDAKFNTADTSVITKDYTTQITGKPTFAQIDLTGIVESNGLVYDGTKFIKAPSPVDSIYKKAGVDSIFFRRYGIEYAIKDSIGSGGGGGSPAGNFGNVQLNRNGGFATPASDSLNFSAGLAVKGTLSATGNATVTGGFIYGTTTTSYVELDNSVGARLSFGNVRRVDVDGAGIHLWGNSSGYNENMTITTTGQVVVNENSTNNIIFRVEGDADANLIYTDPANDRVGIGTASPTDKLTVNGNLALLTAGNKIKITTGSNASVGKSAAMTAGSITISTTAVTSSSLIFLTHATVAGTQGILSVGTITNGTSFVINSSSALDTGTVNWWIVN